MKPVLFAIICALGLSACGKKEEAVKAASPAPTKKPVGAPVPEDVTRLQGDLKRMDVEEAKFIAVPNTPADPAPVEVKKPVTPSDSKEEVKKAAPTAKE